MAIKLHHWWFGSEYDPVRSVSIPDVLFGVIEGHPTITDFSVVRAGVVRNMSASTILGLRKGDVVVLDCGTSLVLGRSFDEIEEVIEYLSHIKHRIHTVHDCNFRSIKS